MRYLITLTLLISALGCSPKISPPAAENKPEAYTGNMVIAFTSRGEGINRPAYEKLKTWLDNYNAKNKTPISYTTLARGREGEKELCFQPTAGVNFDPIATQIKMLLKDEKLIFITEHTDCPK
jgi:hypothetical protein